jgi:hypothetical protein
MLGSVVGGELLCSAAFLQIGNKFLPNIFSTSIRVENLDVSTESSLAPSLKVLVGSEGLGFIAKKVNVCPASTVIHKGHVVVTATFSNHQCQSPEVRLDLGTELRSLVASTNFAHGLLGGLCIHRIRKRQDHQKTRS